MPLKCINALYLHVSAKSVEVIVGLLTFNNTVVFEWVKLTVLQMKNRFAIWDLNTKHLKGDK